MKTNKYILITIFFTIALLAASCTDWLSVEPSDRVSENNAFSSMPGFKRALNGIYIELNARELYGNTLTSEFVEILAQQYAIKETNEIRNYNLSQFQYNDSYALGKASTIWQKTYNLIANTNLLLRNCETNREFLTDDIYNIVKGETLALRGMLHFDLFRLFGPIYTQDTLAAAIPYNTEFSLSVSPSITCNVFKDHVINDLLDAEEFLKNDPIIEYGPRGNTMDAFTSWRTLRLNYYAVQALLARAYLYFGDKENALIYSEKVIEVQEQWFPWVNRTDISISLESPDRVFSSELLFALQNLNRGTIFSINFNESLSPESFLAPRNDVVTEMIFQRNLDDYRYIANFAPGSTEKDGVNYKIFNKYEGTSDSIHSHLIPMLRVSEAYMIAIECETDNQKRLANFNKYINSRGLQSLTNPNWVTEDLEKEYSKEFWGEGQLFFYYKRKMKRYVQSPYDRYGTVSIDLRDYILPIPEGEIKYN